MSDAARCGLQDPSVLRVSSPTPPPPLDPSRVRLACSWAAMTPSCADDRVVVMQLAPPPQTVTPMGTTPQYGQPTSTTMGKPANHQNLMDEIGNSYAMSLEHPWQQAVESDHSPH